MDSKWELWQKLQENGEKSYRETPMASCSVGGRGVVRAFGNFCSFHQQHKVLDIGCGPRGLPGYIPLTLKDVIGIEPITIFAEADFKQMVVIKGIAESLPFKYRAFDRILFATSLDHCVEPVTALKEARRCLSDMGLVVIWAGIQDATILLQKPSLLEIGVGFMKAKTNRLQKQVDKSLAKMEVPLGAIDHFHMRHESEHELLEQAKQANLLLAEKFRFDSGSAFYSFKGAK